MTGPLEFRPMNGLLSIGERIARSLGLSQVWNGENGLSGVLEDKLREVGVPDKPIPLTGPQGITARKIAEDVGFIRRKRRRK